MKIKFRTVLLIFLFIKLCLLFTVLQESIESINANDHPLLFGSSDIFHFDLLLTIICGVSMIVSIFTIMFFIIGHNRCRKPYILLAFGIYLILVIPFFVSGVILIFNDDPTNLRISPSVNRSFATMKYLTGLYHNVTNSKAKNSSKWQQSFKKYKNYTKQAEKMFTVMEHIQKRYCCCGLTGAQYYGFKNKTTAMNQSVPINSEVSIQCPKYSSFKNSTCFHAHLRGCEGRLKSVHPTRILMYSVFGCTFSISFLCLLPFIYSQFELDRRCARSAYIREWRRSIEQHVNDQRKGPIRSSGVSSKTNKSEIQSDSPSQAPTTTQRTNR